jgi:hypothetical protein
MGRPVVDLSGQQFNRLTVISPLKGGDGRTKWICLCSCGVTTKPIKSDHLVRNETKSCGCLRLEEIKKSNTLPEGEASFNSLYMHYKINSAIKRKLSFDITKENFKLLTSNPCYFCGINPKSVHRPKGVTTPYIYNGIDRLNPNIGYTLSNCVSCCATCNYAKRTMSLDEFNSWLFRLVKFYAIT